MKKAKQITCSVAISSLLVGTSSQLFGKTLGAFNDSETTASKIQACEVFPSYINEVFSELNDELLRYKKDLKRLPEISALESVYEPATEWKDYTIPQLKEEVTKINTSIKSLQETENRLGETLSKSESLADDLEQRANTIYKLLEKIEKFPSRASVSCLEDEYPLTAGALAELFKQNKLSHPQIEHLLVYYHTIQLGKSGKPEVNQAVLESFLASIDAEINPLKDEIDSDLEATLKKIKGLNSDLEAVEKLVKKKEKVKEEKEKEEKEKQKEESANKNETDASPDEEAKDDKSSDPAKDEVKKEEKQDSDSQGDSNDSSDSNKQEDQQADEAEKEKADPPKDEQKEENKEKKQEKTDDSGQEKKKENNSSKKADTVETKARKAVTDEKPDKKEKEASKASSDKNDEDDEQETKEDKAKP
ncbi:hypothetical protein [Halobacillus litoralis]|uniref:DUF4047 domain-containing protein n=1 Tax=Halobacillus litoralis TaxID=45668 RepID=A0A410MFL4_9BACI|nr:hypothetical protein [Halobacillus litoralis]QAS53487.1 hypothetical protein HLI_15415 [Halobacillus litoralis]